MYFTKLSNSELYIPRTTQLPGIYDCDVASDVTPRKDLKSAFGVLSSSENDTDLQSNSSMELQQGSIKPYYLLSDSRIRFKKNSYGPLTPSQLASSTKLYFLAYDATIDMQDLQDVSTLLSSSIPIPRCIEPEDDVDARLVRMILYNAKNHITYL